jgi:hypothetical protein
MALNTMNKPTYSCYVYVINLMYYFDNGEYFCCQRYIASSVQTGYQK